MITVLAISAALTLFQPSGLDDGSAGPETVSELLAASWASATNDPERSSELAERALELARAEGDRLGEARALNRLGVAAYLQNDFAGAFPFYAESLRLAREERADDEIADALNNLGVLHYMWGSLDRALTYYEEAMEIRRNQDDAHGLARAYNNLGGVADAAGRFDEAVEYFGLALTLYREAGDEALVANTMNNLGQTLLQMGRLEEAHELFLEAFDTSTRVGDEATLATAEDNIGRVFLAQGAPQQAREVYERNLERRRRLGDPLGTATSLVHLATAIADLGELANAEVALEEALGLVREMQVPQLERDINESLAELRERRGDLQGAIGALRRYHEIHARMISDAGARRLAEINAMFETEKKNAEILRLNQERRIQKNYLGGLVGATVLLAAVVVLLWSRYRIQTRAARVIADKNRELEQAHDELERASRAEIAHLARVTSLGEMTAAVAHELNQPLAAILTNAQLAAASIPADGDDAEELEATVSDITLGARRAWELLHNLRNLARRGDFERRPIDLREVLGQAVEIARAEARLHEVTISLDQPAEELPVDGDPVLLQQVVLNLLQNSIAVTAELEDGKVPKLVTVAAERTADEVEVSVKDPGEPISDEVLANLFRPFFSTREDGLGMGLAISKRLVEAHDGRIWAHRAGARGLVVAFELPICRDRSPDPAPPPVS
ncbi:MAG: tetratricopeptide repeat-containing sensor histidine kinase [Candidatus Sulfomarinibacteraceae bacterium]